MWDGCGGGADLLDDRDEAREVYVLREGGREGGKEGGKATQ